MRAILASVTLIILGLGQTALAEPGEPVMSANVIVTCKMDNDGVKHDYLVLEDSDGIAQGKVDPRDYTVLIITNMDSIETSSVKAIKASLGADPDNANFVYFIVERNEGLKHAKALHVNMDDPRKSEFVAQYGRGIDRKSEPQPLACAVGKMTVGRFRKRSGGARVPQSQPQKPVKKAAKAAGPKTRKSR